MNSDATVSEFERHRPFLTGLAYRMLGSFTDAQDVVQDAFLRWHRDRETVVENPRAWLARIVTRLCLDTMKSARARREAYVGPWLPEPIFERLDASVAAPDDRVDAPMALMLALERLSPLERAAFILHDLFDMEHAEIAEALDRTEAACRQLLIRARAHVSEPKQRFRVEQDEATRITTAFFAAMTSGNALMLRDLLASAAALHSDGGGKVAAVRQVLTGAEAVERFFQSLLDRFGPMPATWSGPLWINGLPGYVSVDVGGNVQTTALEIEDGRVVAVYVVRNPDKLTRALEELTPRPL